MTNLYEDDEPIAPVTPYPLLDVLKLNYECLNRKYRAGGFEDIVGKISTWQDEQDGRNLSLLSDDAAILSNLPADRKITFEKAIDDLWDLTKREEAKVDVQIRKRKLLLLRCRILIYEATDYFLKPNKDLATFFIDCADRFPDKLEELEPIVMDLNGGPFHDKNSRAKVVKVQLIAALSGVNAKYREHARSNAESVLLTLDRLTNFIEHTLPDLHENPRPSFGLLGIAFYLKGRFLSSLDLFDESRKAFRKSSDAYLARLRQKEEFLEADHLKPEDYREKVSLTIRRSALVTAFGDGYLSFVASRITDALESLTVARAALAQNSGKVYVTYVDMLYFASVCALHSSDREELETVIKGLRRCHSTFGTLVPDRHYYHRAGLRLATALFYRAQLSEGASDDLLEALKYIDKARKFAELNNNKHLLSTALVAESRIEMSGYQRQQASPGAKQAALETAEKLAREAAEAGMGFIEKELEASTTLGEIHLCMAELNKGDQELFKKHFQSALGFFREALTKNGNASNIRIEAVCVLQLARLYLLDKKNEALAFQYFERWKKIESSVEHEYCKALARELAPKLDVPFFFLSANQMAEKDWEESLREFLNNNALKQFVANYNQSTNPKKVRAALVKYLMVTWNLGRSRIQAIIKKEHLLDKVMEMLSE